MHSIHERHYDNTVVTACPEHMLHLSVPGSFLCCPGQTATRSELPISYNFSAHDFRFLQPTSHDAHMVILTGSADFLRICQQRLKTCLSDMNVSNS